MNKRYLVPITLLALLAGGLLLQNTLIGAVLFACYCITSGYIINKQALELPLYPSLILAPFSTLTIVLIVTTLLYIPFSLSTIVLMTGLVAPGLAAASCQLPLPTISPKTIYPLFSRIFRGMSKIDCLLITIFFGIFVTTIVYLSQHQTTESLIGPWQAAYFPFFCLFFANILVLLIMIWQKTPSTLIRLALSAQCLIATGLPAMLFPLGFGFDPPLH